MTRYFDILLKRSKIRSHYLDNLDMYLKRIKEFFVKEFGEVKVYLFGSILSKEFDSESDIDVLIVSPKTPPYLYQRSIILTRLLEEIGFLSPFEFHLVTIDEYENWYKNFIKEIKEI